MSTIRVDNITDNYIDNTTISTADLHDTRCEVWCSFNGRGTIAFQSAHNANSLTDIGAACYKIHWTAFDLTADAYCTVGAMGNSRTLWEDGYDDEDEVLMVGKQNSEDVTVYGGDLDDGNGNKDPEFVYVAVWSNDPG